MSHVSLYKKFKPNVYFPIFGPCKDPVTPYNPLNIANIHNIELIPATPPPPISSDSC